jgi:hypothetical protein
VLLAGGFWLDVVLWSEELGGVEVWSVALEGGCDVVVLVEFVSVVVLAGGCVADVLPVPTLLDGVWSVTGGLVGPVVLCPGAAAPV